MSDSLHVPCPQCGAVNRVPVQRLGQDPSCGKCHGPLLTGHPLPLNGEAFARQAAKSDLPLLVDFWAPWCGPCKSMAPAFEQAAAQLKTSAVLAKVNTEEEQGLARQFGIQSIPTMVLFKSGREVARTSGAMPAESIVAWARGQL